MRTYSVFLLIAGLLLVAQPAAAQKKLIKRLFSSEKDTTRAPSFLPLPVLAYSQEFGFEIGLIAMYSFYTDRQDTLTRNSSMYALGSVTTRNQQYLKISADIWSPGNRVHNFSELRLKNFPLNFYGTGSTTRKADEDLVVQRSIQLKHEIERLVGKSNYIGLLASFERYDFRDDEAGGIFERSFTGKTGGKLLSLGTSIALDSRNTNTFTTKGMLLRLQYAYSPDFFGGSDFSGSQFKTDGRAFVPLSKKLTLGVNAVVQTISGGEVPVYLLPQLGNDQMMRGYYSGRYRDKNYLAGQAELRYVPTQRLGVVGFAGGGNVYAGGDVTLSNLKPSYGAGFRYFFDTARGLSIRLDYGLGEKRPGEERQKGFYISLGEAF